MITKYDIGQCVLFKGTVKGIRADENGETYYFVHVKSELNPYRLDEHLSVEEKEIVCGWITERGKA